MLKILISFDYELFLGENYADHKEILIDTTNQIIDLLNTKGVQATLFADVCCALRYKYYGQMDFVNDFEEQLVLAQEKGFDVQLHIHSNWLNSTYNGQKWDISPVGYRVHEFGFSDGGVEKIIKDGIQYLNDVLLTHNPKYRCVAYRAGGYSIQPHSELVKILRNNGIVIDSSVCRHQYIKSNANNYDFRRLPTKMNWWLTPERDFIYEGYSTEGGVFEVPLCSDKGSLIKRIIFGKKKVTLPHTERKGAYIKLDIPEKKKQNKFQILLNYNKQFSLVSFDSMAPERMFSVIKKIEKMYDTKNNDVYISIIGHPKQCNEYVLRGMSSFIDKVKKYNNRFEFITFRQLYDALNGYNQI